MADPASSSGGPLRARPFRKENLAARAWPFCAPITVVLIAVGIDSDPHRKVGIQNAAVLLMVAVVAITALVPWDRLPSRADVVPPVVFVVAVALLRAATAAPDAVWSPVLALPLFWLALHHSRRQLILGLSVSVGAMLLASILGVHGMHDLGHRLPYELLELCVIPPLCLTVNTMVIRQRELTCRLAAVASQDPLTGIGNRRTLDEQLRRSQSLASRNGQPMCVAMIDLDHFKRYNDSHGHPAGDRLLVDAVRLWSRQLRRSDLICRYGGEEFAVLLPECDVAEAFAVLDRLRVATPDAQTCSIGVAQWTGQETVEKLLARADSALYTAKRSGRNQVVAASSMDAIELAANEDRPSGRQPARSAGRS
jgi:diguanylate cyclase (GGDEF)-like protein